MITLLAGLCYFLIELRLPPPGWIGFMREHFFDVVQIANFLAWWFIFKEIAPLRPQND